jgi:hypothetical protein
MTLPSTGCSDATGAANDERRGDTHGEVRDSGGERAEERPLFAVVSRVTLPSTSNTLIAVIDSLEHGDVDMRRALEVPGFAAAHGSPELPGMIFVAEAEAPDITRYSVEGDELVRESTVSFAALGLTRSPRTIVFASDTTAYAISPETYQIIVWNPRTMAIEREIDLSMLERQGFVPAWVFRATLRAETLLIPITWVREGDDGGAAADSALVVLNRRTDEVEVVRENRCGGLRAIYAIDSGNTHIASSAGAPATWHRLYGERGGAEPCLLRLRAGESAFDPEFIVRPAALTDGQVAVDFSPAGPDHLIFQVLDESLAEITRESTAEELWAASAWRFFSVPVDGLFAEGTKRAVALDLPPSALNALRFEVDGRYFVAQIEADYSQTTLMDVSDPASVRRGPTIVGSAGNLFRVH